MALQKRALIGRVVMLSLAILSISWGVSYASSSQQNNRQHTQRNVVQHSPSKSSKPRAGTVIKLAPQNRVKFTYKNMPYYFSQGVAYVLESNVYRVVNMVEGMVIPYLSDGDIQRITIGRKVYYENYDVVYEAVMVNGAVQYRVVGFID